MTKEVLVTVTGFQSAERNGRSKPVELVTPGTYFLKDGTHYLFYNECSDGENGITRNQLRFDSGQVDVRKQGYINVNLLFIPGKRTVTGYQTPMGVLRTAVTATRLTLDDRGDEIDLHVRYALSIGGEDMQDCEVRIHIEPRQ